MDPPKHHHVPWPPDGRATPGILPPPTPLPRYQSPASVPYPDPVSRHQSPASVPTPDAQPGHQSPSGLLPSTPFAQHGRPADSPPTGSHPRYQRPSNFLSPNPYQSQLHMDISPLPLFAGSSGQNGWPMHTTISQEFTDSVAAQFDQRVQALSDVPLEEGPNFGPEDADFDYFNNHQRESAGGSEANAPAASVAPDLALALGKANVHTEHGFYSQAAETIVHPGKGPSNAAPFAQMQAPRNDGSQDAGQSRKPHPSMNEFHGKLRLVEVGEGKCEFVSKLGNRCNRPAPKFEALNGHREKCCMCVSKHLPQWRRSHALLPLIRPIKKTLAEARKDVYPGHQPFDRTHIRADSSLITEQGQQEKWQMRFLAAALAPYQGDNQKLREQQICFNGCVECDSTDGHYSDDQVNSRMALLYHIAWNTHTGGERLYSVHGDNSGYPKEPTRLTFLQRLQMIEQLLRENKRIVMDVIQGRGVLAFVDTPDAYNRRKSTNNTNNEFKKRDRSEDGDDEGVGDGFLPPPRKKRAVNQPAARADKGGKGKEKMQEMPMPVVQDPGSAGNECRSELQQPVPGASSLNSTEQTTADSSSSWPAEEDLKLEPEVEEALDCLLREAGWGRASPTWNGLD